MEKKRIMMVMAWVSALVWMGIIFYLSNQPATQSSQLSTGITERFVLIVEKIIPAINNLDFENMETYIRKNAHFIAYFILGMLVLSALKQSNIQKSAVIAISICIFYAISDEFHQLFVLGRSGQFSDLLIDAAGALLGVVMIRITTRILARRF